MGVGRHICLYWKNDVENYKHLMDTKVMELKRAVLKIQAKLLAKNLSLSKKSLNLMRMRTKLMKKKKM